jgi:RecA-family ATPase
VPYRLPELIKAVSGGQVIYVVEGERKVDALRKAGAAATCNPMGAGRGKWPEEFAEFFHNALVAVLPDNDPIGRDHAQAIALSLHRVARQIKVVTLPDLPPKGDIIDWFGAGYDIHELVGLADEAPDYVPPAAGEQHGDPGPETKADGKSEVEPFKTFDACDWQGVKIEPQRWTVLHWIPAEEPGITSGDGGTGKTKLMLQLAVGVTADWPDWIGKVIEAHGPAVVFSAEEKLRRMHVIVSDILGSRGKEFSDLKGGLHFICDEDDVALGRADRDGTVKPTASLLRLEKTVKLIRPAFIMIENAAEVFIGDERVRGPVAAFVRKLLGGLTQPSGASVALIQHPSLSGLQDGTGRAGSTAWRNAGRWQHNFTTIKSGEDDTDLRQLHLGKINCGRQGEKLQLRWDRGVFVPVGAGNPVERIATEATVDDAFLRCLDAATTQGRTVSDSTGRNYAPTLFEKMPEAKDTTKRAFELAMPRLFTAGKIKVQSEGKGHHIRKHLTRSQGETGT